MAASQDSARYALAKGARAAKHLSIQNDILKPAATAHLLKAGLAKGSIVWDIGCGSGAVTAYLAEVVGDSGLVYAVDVSEEQLAIAKQNLARKGLKNVQFLVADMMDLDPKLFKPADVIYCRFVLMHMSEPQRGIEAMARLLKSGGRLCLHESSMGAMVDADTDQVMKDFYRLIVQYGQKNGFDYNIGLRLYDLCKTTGLFSHIEQQIHHTPTTPAVKELLLSRILELRTKFIESGFVTPQRYEEMSAAAQAYISSHASDEKVLINPQNSIIAIKK